MLLLHRLLLACSVGLLVAASDDNIEVRQAQAAELMSSSGVRLPSKTASLSIKRSSIPGAGLGVFLTRDSSTVKAGTVLTTFGERDEKAGRISGSGLVKLPTHSTTIPNRPGYTRVGDKWSKSVPARVGNEPVGHIINDGASIDIQSFLESGMDTIPQIVEAYSNASLAKMNVNFTEAVIKGSWEMVASRDIQPGEELFISYGPEFWLNIVMYTAPSPFIRVLVYLFMTGVQPENFPDGFITVDKEGNVIHSETRSTPRESLCRDFVRDFLGIKGDKKKLAELGIHPSMSYVKRLTQIFSIVLHPEVFIEDVKEKVTKEQFEEISKAGREKIKKKLEEEKKRGGGPDEEDEGEEQQQQKEKEYVVIDMHGDTVAETQ